MAKKQDTSSAVTELQEFNKESTALVVTLQDLAKALRENAGAAAKFTGESAGAYKSMFGESIKLASQMEGYTVNQLKNRKSEGEFLKKLSKLEQDRAKAQARIGFLQDKLATAQKSEIPYIKKSLSILQDVDDTLESQIDHANKLKSTFENISKEVKVFDDLAGFFAEIPGVSKVFGEFQKAADAAREAAAEGGSGFKAGAKELTGALVKGVAAFGISTMVKGIANADERIVSLGRNLNKSRQESIALVKNFNEVARSVSGLTGTELQKSAEGYAEALGSTGIISDATATTIATQVKYLQLSTEEANKLNMLTEATGGDITKQTQDIIGQTQISNARNKTGIKYQTIMKDVANASNATKLLIMGQGKNLAAAAIEAKKLGTTMEGVANIGKSMLDFESSIANELEAELLTGGEINNERARALALMGDTEGLAKEVAKSGVLAKFEGAKNVLQQEALAKAYGMSKEEMANMVVESKALANLGAKDKSELSEKVRLRLLEIDKLKDAGEREKAKAELIKKLGSDELVRQRENLTIADQQAMANQKIVEAMDMLIPIIKPISEMFKFIADHAKAFAIALAIVTGGSMLSKLNKLTGMFGKLSGGTGGATSAAEGLAESTSGGGAGLLSKGSLGRMGSAFKGGGIKGLLKSGTRLGMKGLKAGMKGNLIGNALGFGMDLMNNGLTLEGAGRAGISALGGFLGGAAGSFIAPGAGTIAGGIGGSMAGDWLGDKIFGERAEPVEDFIIRPGQKPLKFRKDDIIMGGTNLTGNSNGGTGGGNVEALLQELIAAVKQGSNIYLGTNKLNESIGLNLHPMR